MPIEGGMFRRTLYAVGGNFLPWEANLAPSKASCAVVGVICRYQ